MATSTSQVELGFAADSETAQRINKLADVRLPPIIPPSAPLCHRHVHVKCAALTPNTPQLTVDDISKIYNLGEELGRYNFSLGFLCHL